MSNKMLKTSIIVIAIIAVLHGAISNGLLPRPFSYQIIKEHLFPGHRCEVPLQISSHDENQNNIPDALDFVQGARQEAERRTRYDASYYQEGYPPEGKGACTDVIWRAFRQGGYDLRTMVDEDIRQAPEEYGKTGKNPDTCIDYRRVKNLQVYFQRHGEVLTTEVKPDDKANLTNWQPICLKISYENGRNRG